jgi:hypothetical protein
MGLLIDKGHNQGRSRGPACPAHPLEVAGRGGRHRTED